MFRFANPEYLILLASVPVIIAIYVFVVWRSGRISARFGERRLLRRLTPGYSRLRPHFKFGLACLILVLTVLMLARPQYGTKTITDNRKGIEAIIVFDVSNSMLAEDVSPSRMERSKLLVSTLFDRMQNDKVGLAVFAGEAYPQLPITNDYISAKIFLDNITTDMVSLQGTNIGAAIDLASKSFTQEKNVGKAIIIITDGEDHEQEAVEAAKRAAKDGRRVYMLGVGTTSGAQIPTPVGPLTDNSGNVVVTKLNEDMCRDIAKAGNGVYIHVDNSNLAQDQLQNELKQLKQHDSGISETTEMNEQFQAFGWLILVLLVVQLLIADRPNPIFLRLRLFSRRK